jgi:purine-binding chemotaxis protein CheW
VKRIEPPEKSLSHYFDDLLIEDASKKQLEKLLKSVSTQSLTVVTQQKFVSDPNEIQTWEVEVPVAEQIIETQAQQELLEEKITKEDLHWQENGRPDWAQSTFDVLLFQVSGLTLAVPLVSLGQIYPITDKLTPLFGQADWFMGLLPTPAGKLCTVNTAKFVMPERYQDSFVDAFKYVVSINGVPWGLAVDSVNQPIKLEPEQVKWRGDRSKRPWLAGTVKEHMCALLDIARIGFLLASSDKNLHRI